MDYVPDPDDIDFGVAAEPEQAYQTNRELNLARRIITETGANLFLTGKAGTGKTTFLRTLSDTTKKRMVVLAPTGVAAINAHGQTIHSFFQFPFSPYIPGQGFAGEKAFVNYKKWTRKILLTLDLLVIDEVSMVRPDILDAIDHTLRRFRDGSRPFGGVQLLLIGDLRQLPPVVREAEWSLLRPHYASPYFFDSQALRRAGFVTIELMTVYRQSQREFVEILNAVRDGRADAEVIAALNRRFIPGFNPQESEGYIRLTTHNHLADEINAARLAANPDEPRTFTAQVTGRFPEKSYPADATLVLKKGAQVMFVKNDTGIARRFYNGMIGRVTGFDDNGNVIVTPSEGDGSPVTVGCEMWENASYAVNEESNEITQTVEGTFSQVPLRLAWAVTIHKSQGLTFDRAIIDAASSFAPGQAYVALSRCRSLEGMVLDRPIPPAAIITDASVNAFMTAASASRPDDDTVSRLRSEYRRMLLSEVFSFRALANLFEDFYRAVSEYVVPVQRDLREPYNAARERVLKSILAVGNRFAQLYAAGAPSDDGTVAEKIARGCEYFLDQLRPIVELLARTPRELDNAAYEERLANARQALEYSLAVTIGTLERLASLPFSPENYMEAKAAAVLAAEGGDVAAKKESKEKKNKEDKDSKKKETKERKPKGYSQFETLRMFREGKSVEEICAERGLKEATVMNHLTAAVKAGELPITAIVSQETIDRLTEFDRLHPYDGMGTVKEHYAPSGVDPLLVYVYRAWRDSKPSPEPTSIQS